MNWRSGVTKVTLQTYIVNKQMVARNIYYSLYRAVSSRISQTRVCGKNNFLLFPIKDPPLNETLGVQFTPKISEPKCMYDLEYNSSSASGKTLYIFVQRHDVNRS